MTANPDLLYLDFPDPWPAGSTQDVTLTEADPETEVTLMVQAFDAQGNTIADYELTGVADQTGTYVFQVDTMVQVGDAQVPAHRIAIQASGEIDRLSETHDITLSDG